MSTAEELLTAAHVHPVPDTDTYFIIDPITRRIENANRKKSVIMQYDHNSERFTFQIPRYIDGHDMMECTSVTVNADNIESETGNANSDAPDMTDLRLNPDDPETVISSWSISRNLTQLAGALSFSIEYKCVDANGEVVYEWSTDTYDEIEVKARKKNGEAAVTEYTDVLEQWRSQIFGAGDSVMANIAAEGESRVAAVKAESDIQQETVAQKGIEVLESIPDDYTETNNMADEAVRTKSDAIVCEAEGESITITDSSDDHIRGLKMFGKSTQFTTNGYQLFDSSLLATVSADGAIITNNGDGTFTVDGSGVLTTAIASFKDYTHEETVKMLKLGMLYGTFVKTYPYIYVQVRNADSIYFALTNSRPSYEITQEVLDDEGLFLRIGFYGGIGETIVPGTITPMLYQDGDGTWEPYTGGMPAPNPNYPQEIESVEDPLVGIYSKNLIDVDSLATVLNKSLYVSDDKYTVTVVGGSDKTYTYSYYTMPSDLVQLLCGREVRLSVDSITKSVSTAYSPVQLNVTTSDKTALYPACHDNKHYHDFILPKNVIDIKVGIYTNNGSSLLETDNTVVVKGLRLTLVDTPEYELYKPYQTVILSQTLPGIPVTSGGNYTDSDGQQWICDEIDLERGVYVQRVKKITLDGSESWWPNDYQLKQGYYVYGVLLSDAQNAEYSMPVLSDKLVYMEWGGLDGVGGNKVFEVTDTIYVYLADQTIRTVDNFKAYLAENPIEILYVLATSIETPLTAEEIAAFKSLRTNCPNTTILNDAGAWMSVKYNADIKSYIENPKILKLTDSSTGVVYELKIVDGNLTVTPV